MADMNGANVKMEMDAGPHIKAEPTDGASPSPYMDEDDIYEDSGDLDFSNGVTPLWLTRLPAALWTSLSDLAEDEEIEVGTVRIEGNIADPKRVSLKLKDLPQFQKEPKEWHLRPPNRDPNSRNRSQNTWVFAEKDMPGYQRRQYGQGPTDGGEGEVKGRSFLYEKNKREIKKREPRKRFEPYQKKPIPKQIALAGTVAREFALAPVDNEEYRAIEKIKNTEKLAIRKPGEREGFTDLKGATYLAPGTAGRIHGEDAARAAKLNAQKAAAAKDNRAARMPQNELIDHLVALFGEYRFWAVKTIKERIPQPEAYLRETLQHIAHMHRTGDAVGKWELKPDFRTGATSDHVKDEVAPDIKGEGADDMDDGMGTPGIDDDDVEFENVS